MEAPADRGVLAAFFSETVADYIDRHSLSAGQRAALRDVSRCRTPELGAHLQVCARCDFRRLAYNSCRNRHCPTCLAPRQREWIAERQARVLPVPHFHVVFTLPSELRAVARLNPSRVYKALLDAASQTLLTLGEQRLGGQLGVTAVLHTWTRDLRLHPHVHCVVTGGALARDDTWKPARGRFLFPIAVMRALFRGKLMARLQRLRKAGELRLPDDLVDDDAWRALRRTLFAKRWVVYAKRPFGGPEQVFAYLGRYTHRVAISNARIKSWDGRRIAFRTRGDQVCVLEADEFLRRFLLHLLPRGFRKIRHYGLLSPTGVFTRLGVARRCLGEGEDEDREEEKEEEDTGLGVSRFPCCPACGGPLLCAFVRPEDLPALQDSS